MLAWAVQSWLGGPNWITIDIMHMMAIVSVLITLQLIAKDGDHGVCVESCYINSTRWLVYLISLIVELDKPKHYNK
jgi:hypothetical protein